ncbi:MAG: DUF3137 domain-containing protein [Oscillospiraceae bacterium]|nr:DUF3137 domain-containing protein [Oscillospiraceae bacterium]
MFNKLNIADEVFQSFGSFHPNAPNMKALPPQKLLSDEELSAKIAEIEPKLKKGGLILTFSVIALFISFIFAGLFMLPFLVLSIIFGISTAINRQKLKELISNNVVRGVLTETFGDLHYAPTHYIPKNRILYTKLIPKWNKIKGSDLVEGAYKGVKFSFSDLHLQHETRSGKNRSCVTVFKGQWLILELSRSIPWGLSLRERGSDNKRAKSDLQTENIEFNNKFEIKASDGHTAFYVLTPHFMEYIMKADLKANARTYINIGGKQIHIALHNGRDLFEPTGRKLFDMSNIAALRMQMRWDVNYITGIIDEFLLCERLFESRGAE